MAIRVSIHLAVLSYIVRCMRGLLMVERPGGLGVGKGHNYLLAHEGIPWGNTVIQLIKRHCREKKTIRHFISF